MLYSSGSKEEGRNQGEEKKEKEKSNMELKILRVYMNLFMHF